MKKRKILIIGGIPPPVVGTTVRIETLINHPLFVKGVDYDLFDIIDRRSTDNMGRFELTNLALGLKHSVELFGRLLRRRYYAAFFSIAQNKWAFMRDSVFVWTCWLFRTRVVVHLDGGHFGEFYSNQKRLLKSYIDATCHKISAAIVLGESLKANFKGLISDVEVVHAGVPVIGAGSRNNRVKRVLFLSTLFRSKGYLDVLRAVKQVVQMYPDVRFVFVGKEGVGIEDPGDYDVSFERERIIRADFIAPYVDFLGPLYGRDRDEQFRCADIFVFPSYYGYEGKPAVVLQAMSAELPVITTHFPGSEGLIEDGVNGFFVPPRDPQSIAKKILALLKSDQLRREMGRINRRKIENEYRVDDHVRRTIEVLLNHLEMRDQK